MGLYVASLNSGSNGNCYYIGNDKEAVLIDAGISCLETEKRMRRLNLSMDKIKAIFISHEHIDHIKGLQTISNKYQLPVYITKKTLSASGVILQNHHVFFFQKNDSISIGDLTITAFPKFHDAEDPHSFTVNNGSVKIGVFTDIGKVCKDVIKHFKLCHAVFLSPITMNIC
ncbi:MAG: MBL fold metallo-hydrolase [Chitinophagaceae bacterium]